MLDLILNDREIQRLSKRFSKNMQRYVSGQKEIEITYQGGSEWHLVNYSELLNCWWVHAPDEEYYWMPIGLIIPEEHSKQPIVMELNFQVTGEKKTARATLFARNENEEIFIVHSGKIGGGRKGIGKQLFWNNFTGDTDTAFVKGREQQYALVANLDSETLGEEIRFYVEEVQRIKSTLYEPRTKFKKPSEIDHTYKPEFWGNKAYGLPERIMVNANHGLIVDKLKNELQVLGFRVANSQPIDLYIHNSKGKITHLFEVKTTLSKQNIYTAIGQLYLNGLSHGKVKRVFVVPEDISPQLIKDIEALSIHVVTFARENNDTIFYRLDEL